MVEVAGGSSECLNCNRPARDRYGIYFDAGPTIEDVTLCEACAAEFAATEFLSIEAAPMIVRGGELASEE